MAHHSDDGRLVRFGVFELDVCRRELRRGGRRIHLQDKPFDLLACLVARPGEIVSRDDLQHHLWPDGTFVVFDDSLNAAVRKAREALGDSADVPRFIETVPRRGYRFIVPVERAPGRPADLAGGVEAPPAAVQRSPASEPARTPSRIRLIVPALAAALAFLAGASWSFVSLARTNGPADSTVRFRLSPPPQTHFPTDGPRVAVSPNGRHIAFVAEPGPPPASRLIWIQSLDSPAPRPLAATAHAFDVFWSPDSREIAFVAFGMLHRMAVDADASTPLGPAHQSSGGAWSAASGILVPRADAAGLDLVAADSAERTEVSATDLARDEYAHRFPQFMPDGRTFIYLALSRRPELSAVYLQRLGSPERTFLMPARSKVEFVAPGTLLFVRDDRLFAVPFDPARRALGGRSVEVASGVFVGVEGTAWYSASAHGVLAFTGPVVPQKRDIRWVGRSGQLLGTLKGPDHCVAVSLSLDDRWAALECRDPVTSAPDIWLSDLAAGRTFQATTSPANDERPIWSHDSKSIVYARHGAIEAPADLHEMEVATPGEGRPLLVTDHHSEHPSSWSAASNVILYEQEGNAGRQDIWMLPVGARQPRAWLATPSHEQDAVISPDGRWVAYESDRTGRLEVFVRALDKPDAGEWQISIKGGRRARWRRDGRELYFVSPEWQIMAVAITWSETLAHGTPRALFEVPGRIAAAGTAPAFAVTSDGRRFLIAAPADVMTDPPVTVVTNWHP